MKNSKSKEKLSTTEDLYKTIQCFNKGENEVHFAKNAVQMPCQHNICSECLENSYRNEILCGHNETESCKKKVNIRTLNDNRKIVHAVIKRFESELLLKMREDLEEKVKYIKGLFLLFELKSSLIYKLVFLDFTEKSFTQRIDENLSEVHMQIEERYDILKNQLEKSKNELQDSLKSLRQEFVE